MFTSSSGDEENSAELVLVEREKEVNKPEAALAKIAHSPLTIRKLRRAVAEENEADDVPPCIFTSSSGGEENSAEPVLAEREKEVNEHEALGSLSLRKLRTEFNQIVAVAQENEVKEGEKSSQALDKLSLRKLRTKLKETLNAHKVTTDEQHFTSTCVLFTV
jgi:nanoRNase/pAp phosphatase (c-di-AMP/oligoRNAs hydrolase)